MQLQPDHPLPLPISFLMPLKLTHKSLVTINIDDSEYRHVGTTTLMRLHQCAPWGTAHHQPIPWLHRRTRWSTGLLEDLMSIMWRLNTPCTQQGWRWLHGQQQQQWWPWWYFMAQIYNKGTGREWGHGTNAGGCLGFKTKDILKHAGLTSSQWSNYLVCTITPSVNLFYWPVTGNCSLSGWPLLQHHQELDNKLAS